MVDKNKKGFPFATLRICFSKTQQGKLSTEWLTDEVENIKRSNLIRLSFNRHLLLGQKEKALIGNIF